MEKQMDQSSESFDIDLDGFTSWLQSRHVGFIVTKSTAHSCPLAVYIQEMLGRFDVAVYPGYVVIGGTVYHADRFIQEFTQFFDYRHATGEYNALTELLSFVYWFKEGLI